VTILWDRREFRNSCQCFLAKKKTKPQWSDVKGSESGVNMLKNTTWGNNQVWLEKGSMEPQW